MKVDFRMKAPVHTVTQKSVNVVWVNSTGGAKGRTNAIGALLNGLLFTVSLFSFNVNSDVFYAWITQDLLPKVPVGSIIIYKSIIHIINH
jgi:hypothetical protein